VPFDFGTLDQSPDLFSLEQCRLHLHIYVYLCTQLSASMKARCLSVLFFKIGEGVSLLCRVKEGGSAVTT